MSENKLEKALKWIISILQKHNIQYQIAGGFAAHIYGANRPVNDIDIDIPEKNFPTILPYIKNHIIYGPTHCIDKKWDLDIITLDYKGQIIDISGAYKAKIYNEKTQKWRNYPSNLNTSQIKTTFGIEISVMNPNDLIDYKKVLNGEHQKIDIKAVKKYLATSSAKPQK